MNELLTVNTDTQTVSARDLHEQLNIGTAFKDWMPRMIEYGFKEGTDFNMLKIERVQFEGNREVKREVTDYEISVDMAKEICMIQRTPEGRKVRQYLIDLEKAWNTPEQILARALKVADQTIASLSDKVAQMKPKAEFFDAVAGSEDAISMGEAAKVLNIGVGRNELFEFLRRKKILQSDNIPYQKYIDAGYFRTIEQKYTMNDSVRINIKTLVYQRGFDYIRKKWNEEVYMDKMLPLEGLS